LKIDERKYFFHTISCWKSLPGDFAEDENSSGFKKMNRTFMWMAKTPSDKALGEPWQVI